MPYMSERFELMALKKALIKKNVISEEDVKKEK